MLNRLSPGALIAIVLSAALLGAASYGCDAAFAVVTDPAIRVGSEVEFPPFAMVDKDGQPVGFSVDLVKAVADVMGMSLTFATGPWDTVWNDLVSGTLDVLPIVAISSDRRRLIDFSLPHTETFDAFFVPAGKPLLPSIESAQGKEIVVMRSDAAHHALVERQFQGKVVLVDTIPEGLSLVASGQHDAFLCSKLIGSLAIQKDGIKGLQAGPIVPDYKRVFAFGVRKGADELREKLNQGLMMVKTSGEYDRIYEKWLTADDPWLRYRKVLHIGVPLTIAVAIAALFWTILLRKAVKRRTAELAAKNAMLEKEITARTKAEDALRRHREDLEIVIEERTGALRKSEEHYRSLFDNMLNGFAYCKMLFEENRPKDFVYLSVNDAFETLTGLKDVTGRKVSEVIPGIREEDPELLEIYGRVALTGIPERFETYVKALGMWFSISVYSPQREYFVAIFDVITDRKRAEEALHESLAEKVALLKEIHHRVKNNLQIVASLLSLQARRVQDKNVVSVLRDIRSRVHSMALLHEMLYRSDNLAQINFVAYVKEMCEQLKHSFGTLPVRVRVENHVSHIGLPLEQSVPCGLIISELVSNALKHGFPDKREGTVTVALSPCEGRSLVLSVSDDGVGLPKDLDISNGKTLGLQLVSNLAAQLKGEFRARRPDGGGTTITVSFPLPEDIPREGDE